MKTSARNHPTAIVLAALALWVGWPAGVSLAVDILTPDACDYADLDVEPAPESCELRIVNWNSSGTSEHWNQGNDQQVADFVLQHVNELDANVITLQEASAVSLALIEQALPGWTCYAEMFSIDDHIAICVDGPANGFQWATLRNVSTDPQELPETEPPYWWGYVQLVYEGIPITAVHTRAYWKEEHVTELHEDVLHGVVAGDFNYVNAHQNPGVSEHPDALPGPDWFQTDLDLEWTIDEFERNDDGEIIAQHVRKIDHILTVEQPALVWGDACLDGRNDVPEPFFSAHRLLVGRVAFQDAPQLAVEITNAQQPIEVDDSCGARIDFRVDVHDGCCLDADALSLDVTASDPEGNVTVGPVSIDTVTQLGPRDVRVTGHVEVSALVACPARIVVHAAAQDCSGFTGDTTAQVSGATATVVDATGPEVVAVEERLGSLWPPNHAYHCFDSGDFEPIVVDNCDPQPTWALATCQSNQPDDGTGDGNTVNDCVLAADGQSVCVRAERAGGDRDGRFYEIAIEAADACGNASPATGIGHFHVPRSRGR